MSLEDSDMYQAILDGDLAALGCSVGSEESDVNLRDGTGKSFLHIAIELGQQDLVEYLAQKVFLGFRDHQGYTALDLAVRYRMTEVERQLIRRVAGMQDSDETGSLLHLFQTGWRAWPPLKPPGGADSEEPLSPGHQCQLDILQRQKRVCEIHGAVQRGELVALEMAVRGHAELALVADHTGLAPLHKAVLFEWLSLAHYLSRRFPDTLNHPDHMGRTALHYAAAYHEYQDNILYKQLVRAGAREDIPDLVGLTPADVLENCSLLSIETVQEEVRGRLSRAPKDYGAHMSYEESRGPPPAAPRSSAAQRNIKRWRALASVASFATVSHRRPTRLKAFEETELYEAVIRNDVSDVRHALLGPRGQEVGQRSLEGRSFLHLAVEHHVSPKLFSLLLTSLSPAERDCEGWTALDVCLVGPGRNKRALVSALLNVLLGLMLTDDVKALQGLVQDGWQHWPDPSYARDVLGQHVTPTMLQLLTSVQHFMSGVRAVHVAAILHQEVDEDVGALLDTEVAVTCLDGAGLALPHLAVLFYNIALLTRILHAFPFVANLKDSMGRTPLHYAAGVDDDDYMYNLLRDARARDDDVDLCGMRPVDYRNQKQRIVSPRIQESIRDKIHNHTTPSLHWPTSLLSAKMESSALLAALKANDAEAVDGLLDESGTDLTLRDLDGQGFLHQAVALDVDLPIVRALIAHRVDLALRDQDGNTVLDLINARSEPEAARKEVESRVNGLVLEAGEEEEKEAQRLALAGWTHWPVTAQEATDKSPEAAALLDTILALVDKVTAVHNAVQERRCDDLKDLLEADARLVGAADATGLPPLHKALLYQHAEVVQAFATQFKDSLQTQDYMGRTPLHYAAAIKGDDVLFNLLKDAGADETAKDLVGKTALDYQEDKDNLSLEEMVARVERIVGKPATSESPKAVAEETHQAACEPNPTPTPSAPAKPVVVPPVEMYISQTGVQRLPPPVTVDGKYVAQHLGTALTLALAEISERRPWDPIEYLGQWLYKYRQNLDEVAQKKKMLEDIRSEEEKAKREEASKLKMQEELQQLQEAEQRSRAAEEESRKKREQEELQRQAREANLSGKPSLPTVTEEEQQEDEDPKFRKRNEKGQTELHILAAQSGADLVALINLGYSLADRDADNKTPRDIAEDNQLADNVETIDNYVSNLLEQESLDTLRQLILDGYDKLGAVLQQVSTEGLPDSITDFITSIPQQQKQVSSIFEAVSSGNLTDVENILDKNLVFAKDQYGRSPLHLAVLAAHDGIAQYIVKHFRLAVKTRDNLNRTPLHYAAAISEELAELLRDNGADKNAKDAKQCNPAHYESEKEEILALKETLGAEPSSPEVQESTEVENEESNE